MTELAIILLLLVFNGAFAMAEIAVVSARKARLQERADQGHRGAALALKLANNPEQFLSTVQIGITLVGVLAGAYGGASLAGHLSPWIAHFPVLAPYAERIAFALIVAGITYLSLIIGELVPKNLALRHAESIACAMAAPLNFISRLSFPLVWVLGISTRAVMGLLGKAAPPSGPTTAEVEVLVREGLISGSVLHAEGELVEGVFDLREILAEEVMRPKPKLVFLHRDDTAQSAVPRLKTSRQRIFPVFEDSRDQVIGLVSLRQLFLSLAEGGQQPLSQFMREPLFVPDNQPALSLLADLRASSLGAAVVTDEFGIVRGLVTLEDLLEEVVGDLHNDHGDDLPQLRQTTEDAWLVDGAMEIDQVTAAIPGLDAIVQAQPDSFQTLAGFIVHELDRLPREGEIFAIGEFEFDVVDMDRQHIDKVGIRRLVTAPDPTDTE